MGSSLSTFELDSILKLQIKKLLLRVLRQLALVYSDNKWKAWDLNPDPFIPELMFIPPCWVVLIGIVPFTVIEKQDLWFRGEILLNKIHNSNRTYHASRAHACCKIYSLKRVCWLLFQWEVGLAKTKNYYMNVKN